MKRIRTKEIILYIIAMLLCKVSIAECYPFIVAYFTILYLELDKRWLTLVAVYLGMALFLPVTQLAKYGIAVLGIGQLLQPP